MRLLLLTALVLSACSNLDQLEGAAEAAFARTRDAGVDAGLRQVLVAAPALLSRPGQLRRLVATQGVWFAAEEVTPGVTTLLAVREGRVQALADLNGFAADLDARRGEAAACIGGDGFVYSDGGWLTANDLGACLTSPVFRDERTGGTAIEIFWRLLDGGTVVASLGEPPNRTQVREAQLDASFRDVTVRPMADGRKFLVGSSSEARVVGLIEQAGTVSLAAVSNQPLPVIASSEDQRLLAVGDVPRVGLVVWAPSQAVSSELPGLLTLKSLVGNGVSYLALASARDRFALIAAPQGSQTTTIPMSWAVDNGTGVFAARSAFLLVRTLDGVRIGLLDGRFEPFALAFDESRTPPRLLLAHGTDGGSQVVEVLEF